MSSLFFHPLLPRAAATKLMECSPRVRQTAKLGNIHYAASFEIQELQKKMFIISSVCGIGLTGLVQGRRRREGEFMQHTKTARALLGGAKFA
jgi:hypothetical protein